MSVSDLNLEVAAKELAGFAAKAPADGYRKVSLNCCVGKRPTGPRNGCDPVELVAQRLPLLPREEFGERHRLAQGEVHFGTMFIRN